MGLDIFFSKLWSLQHLPLVLSVGQDGCNEINWVDTEDYIPTWRVTVSISKLKALRSPVVKKLFQIVSTHYFPNFLAQLLSSFV